MLVICPGHTEDIPAYIWVTEIWRPEVYATFWSDGILFDSSPQNWWTSDGHVEPATVRIRRHFGKFPNLIDMMPAGWVFVCQCFQFYKHHSFLITFYRAMHFSAKRGIAIACHLSVRPSVCLSVCLSVTLVNCDHIGWNSSKIISPLVSLGCTLFATPNMTGLLQGEHP